MRDFFVLSLQVAHDLAMSQYLRHHPQKTGTPNLFNNQNFRPAATPDPTRPWQNANHNLGLGLPNPKTVQSRINSYTTQNKLTDANFRQQIQSQMQQNYLQTQLQLKQQQLNRLKQQMSNQPSTPQQKQIRGNPSFAKPDYSYYYTWCGLEDYCTSRALPEAPVSKVLTEYVFSYTFPYCACIAVMVPWRKHVNLHASTRTSCQWRVLRSPWTGTARNCWW